MDYHNEHYKKLKIEPWDIMKADLTLEEWRGFCKANIIKYVLRGKNQDLEDADKIVAYALELQKTYKEDK